MTELSFLIDLLMNHKLPKVTKELIANRIKEVGSLLQVKEVYIPAGPHVGTLPYKSTQAPSTLAAMARHGIPEGTIAHMINPPIKVEDVMPVEVIAQTPQTAQAMQSRQQAIAASIAGTVDKTTGRPRKF
jgi:hypothetical protein